ncbi:hypothetical protein JD969_05000 [Planctomycetota bacterium]|nr:hypothetical protein JD969_05000 [Planctomycetota bacterium]
MGTPLPQFNQTSRECGSCNSCCTALSIACIEKPAGEHCENLCEAGCVIYDERPEPCRGFTCLWLADNRGLFDVFDHRPDRLGVMFATSSSSPNSIVAHELWADAMHDEQAKIIIYFLTQFFPIEFRAHKESTHEPPQFSDAA